MARIRSIKPEFFTSEAIASQPLSARLTFIGLWTYVDDNGVGLDNERLIVAAIWPLEPDPLETLQRVREDLRSLQEALLITRFSASGKRLLHIRSWSEHQKVSHPGKPRYPPPPNCTNSDPPETLQSPSGDLARPSALSREQGAGSREGSREPDGGARAARRGTRVPPDWRPAPELIAWARERCPHINIRTETEKFINHFSAKSGQGATKLDWGATWRNWMLTAEERAPQTNGTSNRRSTTNERAQQAIEAGQRVQAMLQGDTQ